MLFYSDVKKNRCIAHRIYLPMFRDALRCFCRYRCSSMHRSLLKISVVMIKTAIKA